MINKLQQHLDEHFTNNFRYVFTKNAICYLKGEYLQVYKFNDYANEVEHQQDIIDRFLGPIYKHEEFNSLLFIRKWPTVSSKDSTILIESRLAFVPKDINYYELNLRNQIEKGIFAKEKLIDLGKIY